MLSEKLISWLDGYLEDKDCDLTEEQTAKIKNKLNEVFKHEIDPQEDKGRNKLELREIHSGKKSQSYCSQANPSGGVRPHPDPDIPLMC